MKKYKLLCYLDSPDIHTGFGVVARNIIGALYKTNLFDIHQLAINYHGEFSDTPWQQSPASLLDKRDPHGLKMFLQAIQRQKYDAIFICNDLFVTKQIVNPVKQYLSSVSNPPIIFYYYPVDCHAYGGEFVDVAHIPICYTNHGREETLKLFPQIEKKLRQIPHGVNTQVFHPLPKQDNIDFKRQLLNVSEDTFVVVSVNRNSARKQIPYSILAFKEFKKQVPNSVFYIHTAMHDQGGDIEIAVKDAGLSLTRDIILPLDYSPAHGVPDDMLNQIYNMGDLYLSTHVGEGFGISNLETLAAGTPAVVPDNTCMDEIFGKNQERGYLYPCNDWLWIDQSGYRKKGNLSDIVETMMKVYRTGPKENNPVVQNGLDWVKQLDWQVITKQWINLLIQTLENKKDNQIQVVEL